MKVYPEIKKQTAKDKQSIEKLCRIAALIIAFVSVFFFFIKILFF
jgi:hypothetical protein